MVKIFTETLTPVLAMFICIAVGFIVRKKDIVGHEASKMLSKLVTWVFCPALNFASMSNNFNIDKLSTHGTNILLSTCGVAVALLIAIPLSRLFIKEESPERGIYAYALAFANSGYMGDPLVWMILGKDAFTYYKILCIPISIGIYTWGMTQLVPKSTKKTSFIKSFFNAPMIATLIGMLVGISTLGEYIPTYAPFITESLDTLKACMGPSAMLVAGFTIANFSIIPMLKKPKVYVASILRLTLIPTVIIAAVFAIKTLANVAFDMHISNDVLYLIFFAVATPLGLNTVVFPESYGGNPETGASMTMVSHTLCVISIPLMYTLMILVFGPSSFTAA